jgi:hypothetical protein
MADITKDHLEECLPPEVQYACLYWIQHLAKGAGQFRDNGQVHAFLKVHFLHWLEALAWMGKVPEGVHAINLLESLVLVSFLSADPNAAS